jgi:hypothetical protein
MMKITQHDEPDVEQNRFHLESLRNIQQSL